jgi:hypothetical protein
MKKLIMEPWSNFAFYYRYRKYYSENIHYEYPKRKFCLSSMEPPYRIPTGEIFYKQLGSKCEI